MTSTIVVGLQSENFFYFAFYRYKITTALTPKEFCNKKRKRDVTIPTPKILETEQGNASDHQSSVVHEQTPRHQNTTAPNQKDFCDNKKKRRLPLPTPEILEMEQSNSSDSQPGVDHGQTSKHLNFDLNKLPDEV